MWLVYRNDWQYQYQNPKELTWIIWQGGKKWLLFSCLLGSFCIFLSLFFLLSCPFNNKSFIAKLPPCIFSALLWKKEGNSRVFVSSLSGLVRHTFCWTRTAKVNNSAEFSSCICNCNLLVFFQFEEKVRDQVAISILLLQQSMNIKAINSKNNA